MLKYGKKVKLYTTGATRNHRSVRVTIPVEMAALMDLSVGEYVYMEVQIENDDDVKIMIKHEDSDHDAIVIKKIDSKKE